MAWTKIVKKKQGEPLSASKDAHRDLVPRTGLGAGAQFVDSASKFLAAYGKVIGPVIAVVIIALATWWIVHTRGASSELEMRNRIDRAAAVAKFDELSGSMETVVAEARDEGILEAYAQYRFAVRAYELLDRPYKLAQLQKAQGVLADYENAFGQDSRYEAWNRRIAGLNAQLSADLAFLQDPARMSRLPWTKDSKPEKPEPRLVDDTQNPIVVLRTSVGDVRMELFESDAANAVANMVSLVREGYYDRTKFSAASFSNQSIPTGPYSRATVVTAGREGRPAGVELKKPTDAKEEDDVDTEPARNPYSIEYGGSRSALFQSGTIAFVREEADPSRARAEFMVVIEPSAALGENFLPLGKIVGENADTVARRLGDAEIYYAWVEQQRKDVSYTPRVYYDGWPIATDKREKKPEPVRFGNVPTQIDNNANPLVVIELESGDILIELFQDVAPNTVANFINLIRERFYDIDCEFYRVEGTGADIAEIYKQAGLRIIQGGNDQSQSRDKYDYNIRNEAVDNDKYDAFFRLGQGGVANARGTIAMARTNDLDGAGTEFFVNLKDWPDWDRKNSPYCVFGRVIQGLELCARVEKDDFIRGAKVIRLREGDYIPEVRYKTKGVWQPKDPVTPPTEEEITKARDARKKADKPAPAPSAPSYDVTSMFG